jgi:hypothetical protein
MRILVLFCCFIVLFVTGCASNTSPYRGSASIITNSENGPAIVFWRRTPKQALHIYPIPAEILVDEKSIGTLLIGSHGFLALKPGQRKIQIRIHNNYPIPNFSKRNDFEEVILIEAKKEAVLIFEWMDESDFNSGIKRLVKTRTVTEDLKKSNSNFVYFEQ